MLNSGDEIFELRREIEEWERLALNVRVALGLPRDGHDHLVEAAARIKDERDAAIAEAQLQERVRKRFEDIITAQGLEIIEKAYEYGDRIRIAGQKLFDAETKRRELKFHILGMSDDVYAALLMASQVTEGDFDEALAAWTEATK